MRRLHLARLSGRQPKGTVAAARLTTTTGRTRRPARRPVRTRTNMAPSAGEFCDQSPWCRHFVPAA